MLALLFLAFAWYVLRLEACCKCSVMQALAVGYAMQGFAVWTASGCRIMSSLRHRPRTDSAPSVSPSGVVALGWDVSSLRLLLCERGTPGQLLQMHFVRPAGQIAQLSVPGEQRAIAPALTRAEEEVHVLQGDDRLLFVSEAVHNGAGELHMYVSLRSCLLMLLNKVLV